MNWVRTNIHLGARLALIALALHFVLAFGHFHRIATAQATEIARAAIDPALPDDDDQSDDAADRCTLCAVMAMADAMLDASPPVLPLRQPIAIVVHRFTHLTVVHLDGAHVAFNPRAPPLA